MGDLSLDGDVAGVMISAARNGRRGGVASERGDVIGH
jgi:hypothetical protein